MDMDDSDGEHGEEVGSDDDSENADGTKSKKKKSQRFYCTDYPPCNLSFTRSEHLARHIRYVLQPYFPLENKKQEVLTRRSPQKTHWRTPLPMPLLQTILSTR